jgi:hypothetical protein
MTTTMTTATMTQVQADEVSRANALVVELQGQADALLPYALRCQEEGMDVVPSSVADRGREYAALIRRIRLVEDVFGLE